MTKNKSQNTPECPYVMHANRPKTPDTNLRGRHSYQEITGGLRQIAVRIHPALPLNPLQILPLNQALNPLLDHRDFRLELPNKLLNSLSHKLLMTKFFA